MPTKKVAVFGNAGGGKSTLSGRLAEVTGLPLYTLDITQFRDGRYRPDEAAGGKLSDREYALLHCEILSRDSWIIDGYGNLPTLWERIEAADTLVYIDLSLIAHYWGVTRRFAGGLQSPLSGKRRPDRRHRLSRPSIPRESRTDGDIRGSAVRSCWGFGLQSSPGNV